MSPEHPKLQALLTGVLLMALLAWGARLRFHAIGAKSLWLDEAATMGYMRASLGQTLLAVEAHDAHPPLYYGLLHVWVRGTQSAAWAAGFSRLVSILTCSRWTAPGEEGWARAFSALVSVLTLLAFYGVAQVLLSRGGALLATLLLAVSAYQVYFAQEARLYALAAFWVTLSWYFFVQLVAGKRLARWPFWLGLALANTAALYTFYYALFSIAAQALVLLLLWRSIGKRLMVPWVAWQLLPAALFAIYVPQILDRLRGLRGLAPPAGLTVLTAEGLSATSAQFACGFLGWLVEPGAGPLVRAGAAGLGVVALVVGLLGWRRAGRAPVVALAWLLGPLALLALLPIRGHTYEPKHLIICSPALALLPAMGLTTARGWLRAFPLAVILLLLGANAWSLVRYFDPRVEKENWRDAIHEMTEHIEPGDIVVLNPPYAALPFHYYVRVHCGRDSLPILEKEAPLPREPLHAADLGLDPSVAGGARRLWLVEVKSHVAIPNPRVAEALAAYRKLPPFPRQYDDLVGRIRVELYDTRQAAAKPTP